MEPKQAAKLLHGVMSAVAHMHARGVVHRDIKAENLMLVRPSSQGGSGSGASLEVKLIDFGFSTVLH
jgi:serine/threonine protein kinase